MSLRRYTVAMLVLGCVWICLLTAAVVLLGLRGEDTRGHVTVSSACTRAARSDATAADVEACAEASRAGVRARAAADDCVIQRRTLKTGWYERITRCPPILDPSTGAP